MKKLYVAICLDDSGSMQMLRQTAVETYNSILTSLKEQAQQLDIFLSLITFNYTTTVCFQPTRVQNVQYLDVSKYNPNGGTALYNAVLQAINTLDHGRGADTSYLVLTITDGEENGSYGVTARSFCKKIMQFQNRGNWTFAFQVPKGNYKAAFARLSGVPIENITEWELTVKGMEEARVHTQSAMRSFTNNVQMSAPGTAYASKAFYAPATTDLSQVTAQALQRLDDLSGRFKVLTLEKEAVVKDFVEEKTGKPYVIGSTYYQLMKPEKVQKNKGVLIVPKGKKTVYGGLQARALTQIPTNQDAKVTPGNHANFDIFVQSRSVNRKLPRGTKILVDTTQTAHLQPTWGII